MPRFTLDWDIFIPPRDAPNFEKINRALYDDLDMELEPLDPATGEGFVQTYQTQYGIIQFFRHRPDSRDSMSLNHDRSFVTTRAFR